MWSLNHLENYIKWNPDKESVKITCVAISTPYICIGTQTGSVYVFKITDSKSLQMIEKIHTEELEPQTPVIRLRFNCPSKHNLRKQELIVCTNTNVLIGSCDCNLIKGVFETLKIPSSKPFNIHDAIILPDQSVLLIANVGQTFSRKRSDNRMKFEKAWIEISHGNVLDISPKGRILLEDEDGAVSILDGFEEEDFYILKEGQCGNSLENNLNVWGKIIQENAQTVRCLVAFDKYPEFCVFGVEDTVEERHDLCSFSYDQSNQFGFDEEIGYLGLVAGSVAEAAILQDGGKVWWFQFDERGSSNDENKDSDEDHRTNTSETNSASDEGSVGDNEDNDEDSNSTTISEAGSTSDEGSVVVNEDSDEEDHTTAISETGSTSDEGSVDDRDERSRGRTRKRGNKVSVTCMYKH